MRKYKVVGAPKEIIVKKGNSEEAYKVFEKLINEQASQGWIYHSMETIIITERSKYFETTTTTHSYMLIFYKDIK